MIDIHSAVPHRSDALPGGLPAGCDVLAVAFVSDRAVGQTLVTEFPAAFRQFAVVCRGDASSATNLDPSVDVLTVPAATHQCAELQEIAHLWVDAARSDREAPTQMLTLHGAQIVWNRARIAILAPADRLPAVRRAVIEAFWYDLELSAVEQALETVWPQLERDTSLAFEFDEKALPRRKELRKLYVQVMTLRSRQTRLSPYVHCPHVHPPTLASQIAERFRERAMMYHRHEVLGQQLEVCERVYETCGQRASEFAQARTGHMLEWIIIVLLLTQILLWGFELLVSLTPTTTVQ